MPSSAQRGYGHAHRKARARLLASHPRCHWCGQPATTADHYPPITIAGHHDNLLPACKPCNDGHVAEGVWRAQHLGTSSDWRASIAGIEPNDPPNNS